MKMVPFFHKGVKIGFRTADFENKPKSKVTFDEQNLNIYSILVLILHVTPYKNRINLNMTYRTVHVFSLDHRFQHFFVEI